MTASRPVRYHRTVRVLALPLLMAGPLNAQEAVPEYTIEQFLETTTIGGASFSPDGSQILVSSDVTGIPNVFAYPADGGEPVQLTFSTDHSTYAVSWFRHDHRFLFTADEGGNELTHLYVQTPAGAVTDLTPGEGLKAQFAGWARDGRDFYVQTNERDPAAFDVWEYDAETYERTLLFENDGRFLPGPVSGDGQRVALVEARTTNDTDVHVFDRRTGEIRHLTPHEGDAQFNPADFSPDGSALYLTTNEGREFARLVRYDLDTGQQTEILAPEWDVAGAGFSRSGGYLVAAVNADGKTDLVLMEAETHRPISLDNLPPGDVTGMALGPDDERMAFYHTDGRAPGDLYVASFPGGEARRLTHRLSPDIDVEHLVEGRVARFESYDGLEIPGILYRPHSATASTPQPALVWVHGGPGGQSRVGYSALIQYLVNHGYVVYAVNNRGSSGYGKTFYALDDRKHGEADLGDVVASRAWLAELPWVDGDRIGIIGGSYGGYMVGAALAFEPEAFDVGVDIFGVMNWLRT
ncbi:MAG: prolyl oligopeptidase family serine peptidase, partial [Gemmatimonadota bacterium]